MSPSSYFVTPLPVAPHGYPWLLLWLLLSDMISSLALETLLCKAPACGRRSKSVGRHPTDLEYMLESLKSWIWMIVNNKFFEKNPKQLFFGWIQWIHSQQQMNSHWRMKTISNSIIWSEKSDGLIGKLLGYWDRSKDDLKSPAQFFFVLWYRWYLVIFLTFWWFENIDCGLSENRPPQKLDWIDGQHFPKKNMGPYGAITGDIPHVQTRLFVPWLTWLKLIAFPISLYPTIYPHCIPIFGALVIICYH